MRDSAGRFVLAYSGRLGHVSTVEAELLAILHGLRIIRSHNVNARVQVESDSSMAVDLISDGCPRHHSCFNIIEEIKSLCFQLNIISCSHIFREANRVADALAKNMILSKENIIVFNAPPNCIQELLLIDMSASSNFNN
uniref:Ribonuclease H protein At1g65750 family n=1 Tax=Cajanus cajan TaxID=3821 RepID=A0A151T1X3_CAJCA|nr:Putative ribonuclease H protein At1g65750 family [Cajanus cajan]